VDNAEACVVAGADGVAVIRAVLHASSPSAALLAIDAAITRACAARQA